MAQKAPWRRLPLGSKLVGTYVLSELARVVRNDASARILGPLTFESESDPMMKRIAAFRARQYGKEAKHLQSEFQNELEDRMRFNTRSLHFVGLYKGEIVSALRVTPPPYETATLSKELGKVVKGYKGFLELGRLVVDRSARGLGLGKKVCYKAMLYGVREPYKGFIAICRQNRAEEFRRFGMRAYQNRLFNIPSRPDQPYHFMWGTWSSIIWTTAGTYGKKRISNIIRSGRTNHWQRVEDLKLTASRR